jgi:hypothetical protein
LAYGSVPEDTIALALGAPNLPPGVRSVMGQADGDVGEGIWEWATPDTVICPCEGVTFEQLRDSLLPGISDPNWVKGPTRAAMGSCRGRRCGALIEHAIAAASGSPAQRLTVRPPFIPVPLGALADLRGRLPARTQALIG